MLFKLIIQRLDLEKRKLLDKDWRSKIYQIWREKNVFVLGNWYNADDPAEDITITVYKNNEHYEKFIAEMRGNPTYQDVAKKLGKIRERIKIVTMHYDPESPMIPSLTDVTSYIDNLLKMKMTPDI